jgi:uncharacterized 2Fe-2S/4Fe-4S cluster protein (DUF4445 family)
MTEQPACESVTHVVVFQPSGRQGRVTHGSTLLDAARELGVDVDSVCGGRQTCGKCKLLVQTGTFAKPGISSDLAHLTPPDATETAYSQRHAAAWALNARLSCAACVLGDVLVDVPPESTRHKQIVGKDARDIAVNVESPLRQVFVEVQPHVLGERDGDWERLQQALAHEWRLHDLRIDLPALRTLSAALRAGKHKVTVTLANGQEVLDIRAGFHDALYGLAVDIGSTSIAAHLCDLRNGVIRATASAMNPQISYGEDLMSRVSYAMMHSDGLAKMNAAVIGALNSLATEAAAKAGIAPEDIFDVVLVGNTVMHHILLGIDPVDLGAAPFTLSTHAALDLKARDLGLRINPAASVHIPALEAGHVGADNVAVLVAETPENLDALTLLIDVGTNAEIVLGNRAGLWSCSSPTGPAFEGAQIAHGQRAAPGAIERVRIDRDTGIPRFKVIGDTRWSDEGEFKATGICGSGIIEVVAELFLAGLLLPDGRFRSEPPHPLLKFEGPKGAYILVGADRSTSGRAITVTQDDVRNIQLAKAALYAGCKLLMRQCGVKSVDAIVLAGAFGSYIDPLHAMTLGLIPDCPLEHVRAVGNAAGDGARILLLNKTRRAEAMRLARAVNYIETAIDPNFQDAFVGAMHLPHMSDEFPNLERHVTLPKRPVAADRVSRRERRRAGS